MRMIALTLVLLAACDSPSPSMFGGQVTRVAVDGSTFRVFRSKDRKTAEAHRVSIEPLPSRVMTYYRAYLAIEAATGCKIAKGSLKGDWAIVTARTNCSGIEPPQVREFVSVSVGECITGEAYYSPGRRTDYTEIECDVQVTVQ